IRMELLHELRNVGIVVDRAFQNREALRSQILLHATQDLSGFLTVWSSRHDKRQAQHFAAVTAHQHLLAARRLDHELRRLPGNINRKRGARDQRERKDQSQTHHKPTELISYLQNGWIEQFRRGRALLRDSRSSYDLRRPPRSPSPHP